MRSHEGTMPLHGVRVLTIEAFGAAPFGSMYLADLGAEVIKIENREQGGDPSRSVGPPFLGEHDSQYFQSFNLNKRSCTLNLKHPQGRDAFHRLVRTADVVMNNLRGDQPDKLGLTYDVLRHEKAAIVCGHLSAYGRDNERRDWPGYDYLMQAEAGIMHLTGEPGAPPTRIGLSMIDFMSGITLSLGILSKLLAARTTGVGGDVDVCLFDVALHQLTYPGIWFLNERIKTGRLPRGAHAAVAPVQLFRTSDGWIYIMCMTEKFWRGLLDVLGRRDLAEDARFATAAARRANLPALTEVLDVEIQRESTQTWLARLQGLLPRSPVYDIDEALDNPFLERIGMIQRTPHSQRSALRSLASPIKLDGRRLAGKVCSGLGADTESLLEEIGYTAEQMEQLRREQAI